MTWLCAALTVYFSCNLKFFTLIFPQLNSFLLSNGYPGAFVWAEVAKKRSCPFRLNPDCNVPSAPLSEVNMK